MEITILDGRRSFYQWDLDRKLQVEDATVEQVHFAAGAGKALVCPVYEKDGQRLADVPNILLQAHGNLRLFAVAGSRTLYSCIIPIHPREKPDDYIYTETEVWTVEQTVEEALLQAKESGDFTGPAGPKGDPGAVKYVVVNQLPETGENAIYLVPVTDGAEDNLFDEYIFADGKWEKLGSTAVAVDMTGYVKNTDIASATALGVVICGEGLYITSTGKINVNPATETYIDAKTTNGRVITPACLDYAVKMALSNNTIALTDEEKAAACGWLGTGVITANEDGTLSIKLADGATYKVTATREV